MQNRSIYFTLFIGLFVFSLWLMWMSLNSSSGQISVSAKFWSDFGSHLPLIRSFSFGQNWPPEYPLYPNLPIQYHFFFYALVGLLEKAGLSLAFALNLPSALGFFAMLAMLFALAKKITLKTSVALLSVLFALFNGSLSWFEFFQKYSLSQLWKLTDFVSFGPWNGSQIGAFWNLNIFTNQRHLGFSFAITFLVIYILYAKKHRLVYLVGFFLGLLLVTNIAGFAIAAAFTGWFFVTTRALRKPLLISFLGLLPWIIFFKLYINPPSSVTWHPGFLAPNLQPLTLLEYWFRNLGPHLLLIPVGLILAWRRSKLFILPLLGLFILPNLIQFSPDLFNNHKFFNFFILMGSIFSAYAIVRMKWLGLLLIPFCIAGGIVDLMPLKNDSHYVLVDYPTNPDIAFFKDQTPLNTVVLNSTAFYNPASLAGRKIYNGYSYFTWSYGYDQVARERSAQAIFASATTAQACAELQAAHISFVQLSTSPDPIYSPSEIWQSWAPSYINSSSGLTIYSVAQNCLNT